MSAEPARPSLLERIAQGDASAVKQFLDRYSALVWSLARKQLGAGAAEDVVQEIFIQLWKGADRFDPSRGTESTFVATVARRRLIDRQRRESRRPEVEVLPEAVSSEGDELEQVDIGDEARRAQEALARLKPEQREVLQLSIVQGLSHTEVAATTGLPLGTVKSHVRRGLERVRELLGAREETAKEVSS